MKLNRVAATTSDLDRAKKHRNRGNTHFYQVSGNPETESAILALVDNVLFSLVSFDGESDWYAHSCTCPEYAEGYASNFAVDIEDSKKFKDLWFLIKNEIKQIDSIPTGEGELLYLGFEIAKKIAEAQADIELSTKHFNFYKKYYPELETVEIEAEIAPSKEPQNKDDIKSFNLKRPCKDCPFRTDLPEHTKGWLGEQRASEIIHSVLRMGMSFPCHKTTSGARDTDDEGNLTPYVYDRSTKQCAGAAILQIKTGNTSAYMQVAERLGWTKEIEAMKSLELDSPVFATGDDFISYHSRNQGE